MLQYLRSTLGMTGFLLSRARNTRMRLVFLRYISLNLLRRGFKNVKFPEEMFVETKDLSFYFAGGQSELAPYLEIFRGQTYDKDERFAAVPGDIVVDVGGHIGFYSIQQALRMAATGKVLVYEPNPQSFARLLKNVRANNLTNVLAFNNAVTSRTDTVKLRIPSVSSEACTIMERGTTTSYNDEVSVQTISLDRIVETHGLSQIDLLKIDAEGAEVEIVQSGKGKALAITNKAIVETHSDSLRDEIKRRLGECGFTVVGEVPSGRSALGHNTMLYLVRH